MRIAVCMRGQARASFTVWFVRLVKIRNYVIILALVGFVGAAVLAWYVGWAVADLGRKADRLNEMSAGMGTASTDYLSGREFEHEGRQLLLAMDTLSNESSGLFLFVENMLENAGGKLDALGGARGLPDDLKGRLRLGFETFSARSKEVGSAVMRNADDEIDLDAYESAAMNFGELLDELAEWSGELVLSHKKELVAATGKLEADRTRTYYGLGGAGLAYFVVLGFFAWWTHGALLSPIARLAHAADESLERGKSLGDKEGVDRNPEEKAVSWERNMAGPEEIRILSRRLWQLVNGLEETVEERTRELKERALALEREIKARRELEMQLVQAQKMEALGQMASGIAHEVNTPSQFIGDNLHFLREMFDEMFDDATEVDEEYVRENVPNAIDQSLTGVRRIGEIVESMRRFAHHGEDGDRQKTPADLNQAVEDSLAISKSRWKMHALVETKLDSDLPSVPCFPGEINQVILNLIVNAADAIAENRVGEDLGRIIIRTSLPEQNLVRIEVCDDGGGVPEAVRERIFEPFFTTKGIGKGTGQGLALAHTVVVREHGGALYFETEAGVGTTFFVDLPYGSDNHARAGGS